MKLKRKFHLEYGSLHGTVYEEREKIKAYSIFRHNNYIVLQVRKEHVWNLDGVKVDLPFVCLQNYIHHS